MATRILEIHSITPQPQKIESAIEDVRRGAVVLYPTDTGFALGCCLSNKDAISRVRLIRRLPQHKHLTFLCHSLTHIAEYAKVSNPAYKTLKRLIPGPYTFILPATKQVPHYAVENNRKTTGIRVPSHPVALALLREYNNPLISITAKHPDKEADTPEQLLELLEPLVDLIIISNEYHFEGESSIIDMTGDETLLIRHGAGIKRVLYEIPEIIDISDRRQVFSV